ncbi:hypothetical protein L3Y34_009297 [Caenorhabditis briggsae]|uniref:T20D4.11-like domain-containing protein n=1 Tax=Caenorhabditis briggsae TaxID=6238 RepID=A0AAE9A3X3_CAEBR|nr:hypothetical protein L3Y34_009297 [Caenorhabditis briggsae]
MWSLSFALLISCISLTAQQDPTEIPKCETCNELAQKIPNAIQELHKIKLEPNDTRVAKMIKMCTDMQGCDSCGIPQQTKDTVETTCNLLDMVNKEGFTACASKLSKENPDISGYECLEGLDFYDKSPASSCVRATTKKECVKKIMEDKCGKDALVDYDKIIDRVVKLLDCK